MCRYFVFRCLSKHLPWQRLSIGNGSKRASTSDQRDLSPQRRALACRVRSCLLCCRRRRCDPIMWNSGSLSQPEQARRALEVVVEELRVSPEAARPAISAGTIIFPEPPLQMFLLAPGPRPGGPISPSADEPQTPQGALCSQGESRCSGGASQWSWWRTSAACGAVSRPSLPVVVIHAPWVSYSRLAGRDWPRSALSVNRSSRGAFRWLRDAMLWNA